MQSSKVINRICLGGYLVGIRETIVGVETMLLGLGTALLAHS